MTKFTSTIYKIGINPVVDPPENVLDRICEDAGRSSGPIPVCGRINGAEFVQTLVKYQGAWRLYINGVMLKDSGLKVGDDAKIEIAFDPKPRKVETHPELVKALRKDKTAKGAFDELSPSRQKEISKYLHSLKTDAAVERNVHRMIRHLRDEETDAHYGLMRRVPISK